MEAGQVASVPKEGGTYLLPRYLLTLLYNYVPTRYLLAVCGASKSAQPQPVQLAG